MKAKERIKTVIKILFYIQQCVCIFILNKFHSIVFFKNITEFLPISKGIINCCLCLLVQNLIQLSLFNRLSTIINIILFFLYSFGIMTTYVLIYVF